MGLFRYKSKENSNTVGPWCAPTAIISWRTAHLCPCIHTDCFETKCKYWNTLKHTPVHKTQYHNTLHRPLGLLQPILHAARRVLFPRCKQKLTNPVLSTLSNSSAHSSRPKSVTHLYHSISLMFRLGTRSVSAGSLLTPHSSPCGLNKACPLLPSSAPLLCSHHTVEWPL